MKRKIKWLLFLLMLMLVYIFSIHVQLAINISIQKTATFMIKNWSIVLRRRIQEVNTTNTNSSEYRTNNTDLLYCPERPPHIVGKVMPVLSSPTFEKLAKMFPWVMPGGRYMPSDCHARHHVAIVIPFRNRFKQLRTFLYNMHPFLKKQQLDYGIYIIEQVGSSNFNRAMLMNIGYAESIKLHNYTCFVFHDIDLLPEDDRNIYSCSSRPRHLSVAIDKFNYRLPYKAIFGGASALSRDQFKKVNGFSNKFFGWGGEDDDMWNRIQSASLNVTRYSMEIARYKMIKHGQERGNKPGAKRYKLLEEGYKRFKTDGINTLKYKVKRIQLEPLYTRISVDINEKEVMKTMASPMASPSSKTAAAASPSPRKRKADLLKEAYESTLEDLDTKLAATLYHVQHGDVKKSTELIEKSRRLIKSSHARYSFLTNELNMELIAAKQESDMMRRREKHLGQQNSDLQQKVGQFKKFITFDEDDFRDEMQPSASNTAIKPSTQESVQKKPSEDETTDQDA